MKINLRNAAKIVSELDRILNSLTAAAPTNFRLNDFSGVDVSTQWEKAANKHEENISKFLAVNSLKFYVRNKIAAAKSQSGLDVHIASLTEYNSTLKYLSLIDEDSNISTPFDPVYAQNLIDLNKAMTELYSRRNVEFSLVRDSERISDMISNAKKAIRDLDDKILHLNVTTQVDISGTINGNIDVVNYLQELKII